MMFLNLDSTFQVCHNIYNRGVFKGIASLIMTMTNILHSSDIQASTMMGKNVHFGHRGIGIVIHEKALIGDNTTIMQNVTVAAKENGYTIIENYVIIGAGAVILGAVTVGEGAVIGANAVVNRDVAPYTVMGGVPAKVLKKLSG